MVLDTSALIVLLLDEPEAEAFRTALELDEVRLISAATLLETAMVIETRKGEAAGRELDRLIDKAAVSIIAVDADQIDEARRAWRRFGRGRHEASLDYGDLFAYALSRTTGEALLFKGDDFRRTDVARVI